MKLKKSQLRRWSMSSLSGLGHALVHRSSIRPWRYEYVHCSAKPSALVWYRLVGEDFGVRYGVGWTRNESNAFWYGPAKMVFGRVSTQEVSALQNPRRALMTCTGCGRFMYCSKEHQTLLWNDEHNFVCLKTHKLSKKRGCKGVPS